MAKYIDREETVKKIEEKLKVDGLMSLAEEIWTNNCLKIVLRAIMAVETADVQPTNRWISVKDRLPEATYDCLVWYSCDTAFGKSKSWGIAHCSRCDWYTKHLDGDNIVVLYWMPLPEPPKDD